MLEVVATGLGGDIGPGLCPVGRAGHLTGHHAQPVYFDDHAVLGELLLDQDDLLSTSGDEIAARVVWALVDLKSWGQARFIYLTECITIFSRLMKWGKKTLGFSCSKA